MKIDEVRERAFAMPLTSPAFPPRPDGPPIYGGRELWGFPKKYAQPSLGVERDTLIAPLTMGPCGSPLAPWASSTKP